jgi:hypothetical protein
MRSLLADGRPQVVSTRCRSPAGLTLGRVRVSPRCTWKS